ncbi:unnamed protein product [Enterobius vermicularis]|uniref:Wsv460 n=1 Tax=Enterobius vermicularis TaxID=51028 RepID=A0A0N4VR97_ENTVE|nr:unnamed protein product [Enterobius vermicularis]
MMITMKMCVLILTVITVLCMASLTAAVIWYLLKNRLLRDGRSSSPIDSILTNSTIFNSKTPPPPPPLTPSATQQQ